MIQTISYPIADVVPYINWLYFFHAWQLPTGYASLKHLHRCPSCRAHWVTQYPEAERDKASASMTKPATCSRLCLKNT